MKICYIDESGCTGALPTHDSQIQPALILIGLFIDYRFLHKFTEDFISIKRKFNPKLLPENSTYLSWILKEIKGSDLRNRACSASRNDRRQALGYLGSVLNIAEECEIKITGRIWIKSIGNPLDGRAVYTSSVQSIYGDFQNYLQKEDDYGFIITDSRAPHLNAQVAHSIFTQKFKGTGDSYDRIIELPAFSHSQNHAGLQICDTITSSIITPIAIETYCKGIIESIHVKDGYCLIKDRFKQQILMLQHRYKEASGRSRGGLTVSDGLRQRPGGLLFR